MFNYLRPNENDDVHKDGCKYSGMNQDYRYNREDSYSDFSPYPMSFMKQPIGTAFKLSPEATSALSYTQFHDYSDTLLAEKFEGLPKRGEFTAKEWYAVRNTQKVVLVESFEEYARQLWMTKTFRRPME